MSQENKTLNTTEASNAAVDAYAKAFADAIYKQFVTDVHLRPQPPMEEIGEETATLEELEAAKEKHTQLRKAVRKIYAETIAAKNSGDRVLEATKLAEGHVMYKELTAAHKEWERMMYKYYT